MKPAEAEVIEVLAGREEEAAERAARVIKDGGLVVYPTESFYGLGADPSNEKALRRLFEIKGRPPENPILLLLPSREAAAKYAARITHAASVLMNAFWPGALTIVFDAAEGVSQMLTGGTGKIGLRLSSHPFAMALCRALGSAVTGTSANRSGSPPHEEAREAGRSLGKGIDLVVNGGRTPGGQPSTVVDATDWPPRIIRAGLISETQIKRVFSREGIGR